MELKPDWEEAAERLAAWWRGEIVNRVALQVTAPREQPLAVDAPAVAAPDDLAERWLDPNHRIAATEQRFASTWYGGEAFPYFDPHLGPGSLALYLGSEPSFAEDTVWYQPCIEDLDAAPELHFDPGNRWWQATMNLVAEGVQRGRDRYLTAIPDLIENLDTLASLRGTQSLLHDLSDRPRQIHELQRQVLELYFRCFDDLWAIASDDGGGCCFSAFQVWAPGKMAKLQCDFSAMISPAMFEEFVVPYLSEQCERLDYSVYHLDGVDAVKHLDLILAIPKLTALQWTPGANQPGAGDPVWLDMYRQAREAGKPLLLIGVGKDEAQQLVKELGPEGLLISTSASSQEEGEALLKDAEKWKVKRRRRTSK